jgi:hypothetical protein
VVCAEQVEITHHEEQGDQSEKDREHQPDHERVVDQAITRELEAGQDVCGHRGQQQGQDQRPGDNDQAVDEVLPNRGLRPGANEVVQLGDRW